VPSIDIYDQPNGLDILFTAYRCDVLLLLLLLVVVVVVVVLLLLLLDADADDAGGGGGGDVCSFQQPSLPHDSALLILTG